MPYVSKIELELLLFQKFFFPGLYFWSCPVMDPSSMFMLVKSLVVKEKHRLIVLRGKV